MEDLVYERLSSEEKTELKRKMLSCVIYSRALWKVSLMRSKPITDAAGISTTYAFVERLLAGDRLGLYQIEPLTVNTLETTLWIKVACDLLDVGTVGTKELKWKIDAFIKRCEKLIKKHREYVDSETEEIARIVHTLGEIDEHLGSREKRNELIDNELSYLESCLRDINESLKEDERHG